MTSEWLYHRGLLGSFSFDDAGSVHDRVARAVTENVQSMSGQVPTVELLSVLGVLRSWSRTSRDTARDTLRALHGQGLDKVGRLMMLEYLGDADPVEHGFAVGISDYRLLNCSGGPIRVFVPEEGSREIPNGRLTPEHFPDVLRSSFGELSSSDRHWFIIVLPANALDNLLYHKRLGEQLYTYAIASGLRHFAISLIEADDEEVTYEDVLRRMLDR